MRAASENEAYAILAQLALSALWAECDVQPDSVHDGVWGCCPECCAPCAALLYLDRSGVLDEVLAAWPEGTTSSAIFVDGRVDRDWMYRQWVGSPVQQQCGHSVVRSVSS